MTTRGPRRSGGMARLLGFIMLSAGAAVIVMALPRWVWLLALGALLLWVGVLLAGPNR